MPTHYNTSSSSLGWAACDYENCPGLEMAGLDVPDASCLWYLAITPVRIDMTHDYNSIHMRAHAHTHTCTNTHMHTRTYTLTSYNFIFGEHFTFSTIRLHPSQHNNNI